MYLILIPTKWYNVLEPVAKLTCILNYCWKEVGHRNEQFRQEHAQARRRTE